MWKLKIRVPSGLLIQSSPLRLEIDWYHMPTLSTALIIHKHSARSAKQRLFLDDEFIVSIHVA